MHVFQPITINGKSLDSQLHFITLHHSEIVSLLTIYQFKLHQTFHYRTCWRDLVLILRDTILYLLHSTRPPRYTGQPTLWSHQFSTNLETSPKNQCSLRASNGADMLFRSSFPFFHMMLIGNISLADQRADCTVNPVFIRTWLTLT